MELKALLESYSELRSQLVKKTQEIVQLHSKLSYLSADRLASSGVGQVDASRASLQIDEEISDVRGEAKEILQKAFAAAKSIKSSFGDQCTAAGSSLPLDKEFVANFARNFEQQVTLEYSIVDAICSNTAGIDQDSLTTMLACFEYPPYLADSSFNAVVDAL